MKGTKGRKKIAGRGARRREAPAGRPWSRGAGPPLALSAGAYGVLAALLALLVGLVYARSTAYQFVYDDFQYLVANPFAREGLTGSSMWWALTSFYASNWHPLTWVSHLLDVTLFGMEPGGHHVVSAMMHALNAGLLFVVLSRLTGRSGMSALAAALFAAHPLQVESVVWISERKNLLSTLFLLLTIEAYRRYAGRPGTGRYLAVVGIFTLALMAKPMVVTLPLLLLLIDYWPLQRLRAGMPAARLLLEKLPLLLLSAGTAVLTVLAQEHGGSMRSVHQYSLPVRAANALVSYAAYIGHTLWPSGLNAFYPHAGPAIPIWKVAGAGLFLTGASWWAIRQAERRPWLAVGWLWYLIALLPVIGLVQVGDQAMADRYMYLPIIGLLIVIARGLDELAESKVLWKGKVRAAAVACAVLLAGAATVQTTWWENNETLFKRALAVTSDNWFAHISLAASLGMQGDTDGAVAHHREALSIRPRDPILINNLAFVVGRQNRIEEAMGLFREAAALKSDYAEPQFNIGVLHLKRNDFGKAEAQASILESIDRRWAGQLRDFIRYKRNLVQSETNAAPDPGGKPHGE